MDVIYIDYYSSSGHVEKMAQHIVRGIVSEGEEFQIRKIKPLRDEVEEGSFGASDLHAAKAVVMCLQLDLASQQQLLDTLGSTTGLWLEKKLSGRRFLLLQKTQLG